MMACAGSPAAMRTPAFIEKMKRGPVAFMTVIPSGPPSMRKSLMLWFVYSIFVGVFASYVAGSALRLGADYLEVCSVVGTTAFLGYSFAFL